MNQYGERSYQLHPFRHAFFGHVRLACSAQLSRSWARGYVPTSDTPVLNVLPARAPVEGQPLFSQAASPDLREKGARRVGRRNEVQVRRRVEQGDQKEREERERHPKKGMKKRKVKGMQS